MERKQIFVLGRFYEVQSFIGDYPQVLMPFYLISIIFIQIFFCFKSDFYVYDIEQSQWTLICADTNIMGGPKLLFDHQMVMDSISSTIYVFGGRVVASSTRFEQTIKLNNNILKKKKLVFVLFILDAVLMKLIKTIQIFQVFTNIMFQLIHGHVFYQTHSTKSKSKMDF